MQLQSLFEGLQSADSNVRNSAEKAEAAARAQRGYGEALVNFLLDESQGIAHRHMAALLLKSYINNHWDTDSETFQEPTIVSEEKDVLRQALPQGLSSHDTKLRTAVAMAVSSIAKWDYPADWPALLPGLLRAIGSQDDLALASGALSCLSMFADDLDEDHTIQVVPALFPHLLNVLKSTGHGPQLHLEALKTFNSIIHICLEAVGPKEKEAQAALYPHLEPWCRQFCQIIAAPVSKESGANIAMKTEVLKILTYLFSSLGRTLQQIVPPVLRCCFSLFSDTLALYQQKMILGQDGCDGEDELSNLVNQMFELLSPIAGNRHLKQILKNSVHDLTQLTIAYMQITRKQEAEWLEDVNTMLTDEDDLSFTVRSSAYLFLDELSRSFFIDIFSYLSGNLQVWFAGAKEMKEQGDQNFWRLKEAALMAVQSVSDQISDHPQARAFIESTGLMQNLFLDFGSTSQPILMGRTLVVASIFAEYLDSSRLEYLAEAIAGSLAQDAPATLQAFGAEALSKLCESEVDLENSLKRHIDIFYTGLITLVSQVEEEALQRILATLRSLISLQPESAIRWQSRIAPPLLQIWVLRINDPCLAMDCVEVFEILALIPGTGPSLQATVVPVLKSIISKGKGANHPVLIEGAVDLATCLLRGSSAEAVNLIHEQLTKHIIDLLGSHDDPGIVQSCCEFLAALINKAGKSVLSLAGSDPDETVKYFLEILQRLLQPESGDSAPVYVGRVLDALLRHCPETTLKHILNIMPALLRKLVEAKSSPLVVSLLLVCCNLILVDAKQLIEYAARTSIQGQRRDCLEALLQIWVERQLDFQGQAETRLSCAALGALLATRHSALSHIKVKGQRMDLNSATRTRSKARCCQEAFEMITAPEKIASILAEALLEEQEGDNYADSSSDATSLASEQQDHLNAHLNGAGTNLPISKEMLAKVVGDDGEATDRSFVEEGGPLAGHSITSVIASQLKRIAQEDSQYLEAVCKNLPAPQVQALRNACSS